MRKLVPHPLLSLALVLMWILLNQPSLGHLLLGSVIALFAGRALAAIEPQAPKTRNPVAIIRLFFIVGLDIIRSNIAVAWLVLTRDRHGARQSRFVEIPLRIDRPVPLAILSIIVTATPGTAWIEYVAERRILLLHVFDFLEEADWQDLIGNRYESLLMEIFP